LQDGKQATEVSLDRSQLASPPGQAGDGDAGIIDGLTTEGSLQLLASACEAVCLPSPRIIIRLRQIQDCAPPVIGAHNDSWRNAPTAIHGTPHLGQPGKRR
jgi:hypothetical protein